MLIPINKYPCVSDCLRCKTANCRSDILSHVGASVHEHLNSIEVWERQEWVCICRFIILKKMRWSFLICHSLKHSQSWFPVIFQIKFSSEFKILQGFKTRKVNSLWTFIQMYLANFALNNFLRIFNQKWFC